MTYNISGLHESDNVIISLGLGSGATELAADLPCLCLDIDRRSVYSAIVNLKGNCIESKKCTYHSLFDIRNGDELYKIFTCLRNSLPNHKIQILFQHPNPNIQQTYKKCSIACMNALKRIR